MKNVFCILVLFFVFFESSAFATGGVDGNGGDAVVCRDPLGNIMDVRVLDYFEAERFKVPLLIPTGIDHEEILNKIFLRLEKWSPGRVDRFRKEYQRFLKSHRFSKSPLPDIPDSGMVILPWNCELKQFAYQIESNGKTKYVLSQSLWDKASPSTRAGLIFHELIYQEFKKWKMKESVEVRRFHRYILSTNYDQLTHVGEWLEGVHQLGVPVNEACAGIYIEEIRHQQYQRSGYPHRDYETLRFKREFNGNHLPAPDFKIGSVLYSDSEIYGLECSFEGKLMSLHLGSNTRKHFVVGGEDYIEVKPSTKNSLRMVTFFPNGRLYYTDRALTFRKLSVSLEGWSFYFYPSGALYRAHLYSAQESYLQNKRIKIKGKLEFYEGGEVLRVQITQGAEFRMCDGTRKYLKMGSDLIFLRNGCVDSFEER